MGLLPRLPAGRRGCCGDGDVCCCDDDGCCCDDDGCCDDFARFLVCIMSEMEISFYWAKSCMFRDMRSVFCLEWWGKPLELEQQSEQ